MIRSFLKLYALIAVPVALVLVIGVFATDRFVLTPDFAEMSRETAATWMDSVMRALHRYPQSEWVRVTEIARDFYPNHLDVMPIADSGQVNFLPRERTLFETGRVALVRTPEMFRFYQQVPNAPYFLRIQMKYFDGNNLFYYMSLLALAGFGVGPVLFLWFRAFWRDLGALQDVANQIGQGRFEIDAQASKLSTLSPAALALTGMSHRVRELLGVQRELTAAVGHELRTPITQLGFALALVERASTGNTGALRHLAGMRSDLTELDLLVDELLVYSRLDQGPRLELEFIELRMLLEKLVSEINSGLPVGAVEARLVGECDLVVLCDAHLIARAVSNLVRNAVRYARTRVEISACRSDEGRLVTVRVDDDGPGIPLERREAIFEPFVRVDASRSRSSGGYGLGLAIVRRIALGHSGRVWMEDGPLGGLRVCLAWEGLPELICDAELGAPI